MAKSKCNIHSKITPVATQPTGTKLQKSFHALAVKKERNWLTAVLRNANYA
jgi:hypothetical protein